MECADCRPIPHAGFCFGCGRIVADAKRAERRYEVSLPGESRSRLGALLGALSDDPEALLLPTLALERFVLVADVGDGEGERLESLVASTGAAITRTTGVLASETSSRFVWTPSLLTKMAVVGLLGAAGSAVGVLAVPVAAVPVLLVLAVRARETVAHELRISRGGLERTLGILDQALLAEVRLARGRLTDAQTVAQTRACIEEVADITWLLCGDARSAPQVDLARIRTTLGGLVRQTLKIAAVADAVGAEGHDKALRQIEATHTRLTGLRETVAEGVHASFQREAPYELLRLLSQAQREIDEAVEVTQALWEVEADLQSNMRPR